MLKIWKTRKTEGISKMNYLMTGGGLLIMLIQAIDYGKLSLMISTGASLSTVVVTTILIFLFSQK
jgi:uncharacterized protein with PQ loop repeat